MLAVATLSQNSTVSKKSVIALNVKKILRLFVVYTNDGNFSANTRL